MKKILKIIGLIILAIIIYFGISGYIGYQKHKKAQKLADKIIENLDSEKVYSEFSEEYFSIDETKIILTGLREECDWKNRHGKFVDFFKMKRFGGVDQTAFIYEYRLKCDDIRVILTMNMENSPELMGFKLEGLETKNPMIIDPKKQLKL